MGGESCETLYLLPALSPNMLGVVRAHKQDDRGVRMKENPTFAVSFSFPQNTQAATPWPGLERLQGTTSLSPSLPFRFLHSLPSAFRTFSLLFLLNSKTLTHRCTATTPLPTSAWLSSTPTQARNLWSARTATVCIPRDCISFQHMTEWVMDVHWIHRSPIS
jgi:hypothetical protein